MLHILIGLALLPIAIPVAAMLFLGVCMALAFLFLIIAHIYPFVMLFLFWSGHELQVFPTMIGGVVSLATVVLFYYTPGPPEVVPTPPRRRSRSRKRS